MNNSNEQIAAATFSCIFTTGKGIRQTAIRIPRIAQMRKVDVEL